MTDEAQVADWPCEHCGAQAHEPCKPDCRWAYDGVEFSDLEVPDVYAVPSREESLSKLMAAVHRLPLGGLVGEAPHRAAYDEDEFLSRLADWMANYQAISRVVVDDLQRQSRERISLQLEKEVVRRFLTGTIPEEVVA